MPKRSKNTTVSGGTWAGLKPHPLELLWPQEEWGYSHGEGGRMTTKQMIFYIGDMADSNGGDDRLQGGEPAKAGEPYTTLLGQKLPQ
jgi:hypothetical protein